jgi:hypothetical protein
MPGQVSSSDAGGRGSRWSWLLPAGTFLAGCALGGVVVGVGAVGGDDEEPSPPVAAAETEADGAQDDTTDGATDEQDPADSGLYVRVPDSCVQTAEDATTLVEQVDRVVEAVADLQPERLRQTVDDVQQIRDEVQDVAEQCQEAAAQRLQDAEAGDDAPETPSS